MDEYDQFLGKVIERGIEAARHDYTREDQKARLEGSIAGFEACWGLDPEELRNLLAEARERHMAAIHQDTENQLWASGFEAEVEWVCNVISSLLRVVSQPVIITPSARGMLMAVRIMDEMG